MILLALLLVYSVIKKLITVGLCPSLLCILLLKRDFGLVPLWDQAVSTLCRLDTAGSRMGTSLKTPK